MRANAALNAAIRHRAIELGRTHGLREAAAVAREASLHAGDGPARSFARGVELECAERAGLLPAGGRGVALGPDASAAAMVVWERVAGWLESRLDRWLGEPLGEDPAALAAAELNVTARQLQCLRHAAAGLTAKESGRRFDPPLDWRTVEDHLNRLRRRLGAKTTTQAVAIGYDRGLLIPLP